MFRSVLRLVVLAAALPAAAQSPFDVGRVFGMAPPGSLDVIVLIDTDGSVTFYQPATPDLNGMWGIEWDAPRDRVLFIAEVAGDRRIGQVDSDLDPASAVVLRAGLGADAQTVDVDPDTGEIYWWEGGQILSVGPNGGGTPTVEAQGVPLPATLEIDVARGVYLGGSSPIPTFGVIDELFAGPLDPAGSPTTFSPIQGGVFDVAIDPITGDFVWTESGLDATAGFFAAVVRSTNTFGSPTVVAGTLTPNIANEDEFYGVGVMGDTIGVSRLDAIPGSNEVDFRVYDASTGAVDVRGTTAGLYLLDIEVLSDPIIEQPQSVLVDAGQSAQLTVASLDPGATFQWRRQGVDLTDDARISGSTSSTLTIDPTEIADTNRYTCRVVTTSGAAQVSNSVILAVRGDAPPPDCPADQNFDGILSPADFNAWILNYNAGCP